MHKRESISKPVSPEEIRAGTYIAVLHIVTELLPMFCFDSEAFKRLEVKRLLRLPWNEGQPLEVQEVCIPFVLVKEPCGKLRTLDVRRYRFAQLSRSYGRRVFRMMRERAKTKAKSGGAADD